jgi:hypothetical protein
LNGSVTQLPVDAAKPDEIEQADSNIADTSRAKLPASGPTHLPND